MRLRVFLASVLLAAGSGRAEILVRGAVTDETGAVGGARIELRAVVPAYERGLAEHLGVGEPLPLDVVRSAADGSFVLSAPSPGLFRVAVLDRGRLSLERTIGPVVESRELETVSLARSIALTVTVVDPEGRPVLGARVRVAFVGVRREPFDLSGPARPWHPPERTGVTAEDGRVVLPIGEDEVVRVAAFHPGFPEAVEERLEILTETTLRLERGVARTLEVRGPDSRPAAGALVRQGSTPLGVTGDDGRLEVAVPPDGGLEVSAETAAGLYGRAALAAPRDREPGPVALVLSEPERLSGRVTDAATKRPVAGAWVAFGDAVTRADGGGSFLLPVPAAGERDLLHAEAPGYLPGSVLADGRRHDRIPEQDLVLQPWTTLAGVVVEETGSAVAGAEIVATRSPDSREPYAYVDPELAMRLVARYYDPRNFARSDAEGRFHLRVSPGEVYDLEVKKAGFLTGRTEASAAAEEELVVTLERGRTGVGLVLDLDERPVAGATVRLWTAAADRDGRRESTSWESTTGGDGRFELRELRSGPSLLRATAPGFAPLAVEGLNVVFEPGEPEVDLGTLLLEPGVRVAGRVVDPRGRPLAGVKVAYEMWSMEGDLKPWELDRTEVSTGEDGGFAIGDMVAGEKLDLTAWHIDYATTEARGIECPTEDLELVLEPTAEVRGRVVGPGGAPVADGQVSGYYQARDGGPMSQSARVGPDGGFVLAYLGSRSLELEARARGFRERRVWLEVEPGEVVDGIVLELDPGAAIEGLVLGPAGEPVGGARVFASRGRFAAESTDAAGRFRLGGLEIGTAELEVVPRELPPGRRTVEVKAGVNTVEIRLEGGFEVHGRTVDVHGAPVPSARVSLAEDSTSSGADGSFSFAGVARGVHRLAAAKRGYARRELPGLEVDGPVWDLEVVLHRGGTITGLVLGLEAAALGRVQVLASSLEDQWTEGRVDFDGRYRLGPLAPGRWNVEAADALGGRSARGSVELEPEAAEAVLDLEFVPGLVLTGEVRLDGAPVSGAAVRLQGLDVMAGGHIRTDYGGAFRFEGLRRGRYRAVVRGVRKELLEAREIELAGDDHLVFELATGELLGRSVDAADGRPVADAEVTLEPPATAGSGETIRAETGDDGRFRFTRLAAGSYLLRVERVGYGVRERLVDVEPGAPASETVLELERTSGVVLAVEDAAGGRPAEVWAAAYAGPAAAGEPALSGRFLVGSDGTARLASLPPGLWTLVVRAPASGTVRRTATAPGDVVPVRLPPGTRLEIGVPELEDGAMADVEIAGAGGPFVAVSSGGARRRWRLGGGWTAIEGLPPGPFTVTVTGRERVWTGRAVAPADGGSVRLELE